MSESRPDIPDIPETETSRSIREIAWAYRLRAEEYYGWADDPRCFTGACSTEAKGLAEHLRQHGYPDANATGGYYNEVEDGYLDIVEPGSDDFGDWDNRWKHWYVSVAGLIVDTTADQFHPSCPDEHRLIVTGADDPRYGSRPNRNTMNFRP